jgi:hypothetical protein
VCFCVCASLCFAEWWSSCKLELVYIIVDMTHFSSAWHATPYQPGPASKHEWMFPPTPLLKDQESSHLQEKTKRSWAARKNSTFLVLYCCFCLPYMKKKLFLWSQRCIHNLVLGTLVLSPLHHHVSHLGLQPTYHEDLC